MILEDFLSVIWPTRGHYCLAGFKDRSKPPQHFWYRKPIDAQGAIAVLEGRGFEVYHACASFTEKSSRKASNALAVRSLWMDIDVDKHDNKKYLSQKEAAHALKRFTEEVGLVKPSYVINSGGGLHVYWCFDTDIEIAEWHTYADALKRLATHHKFRIDHTRTADAASLLRPVGSLNAKYSPPVPVLALFSGQVYRRDEVVQPLLAAVATLNLPPKRSVNSDYEVKPTYAPADADRIADSCAQMGAIRSQSGNTPEPIWYAGLQVLQHCQNGKEMAHEWSKGYEGYSAEETDRKLSQAAEYGPTACSTFESRNPEGCAGCPHLGRITSPIQLGREVPESEVVTTREFNIPQNLLPKGFRQHDDASLWFHPEAEDKLPVVVSTFPFYAEELAWDDSVRLEVMLIRAYFPQSGEATFAVPTTALASPREIEAALRAHHIKVGHSPTLRAYLAAQIEIVERLKPRRNYYTSFGWKDGTNRFLHSHTAYYADGHTEEASMSEDLREMADDQRPQGSLEAWVEGTRFINGSAFEPHAFVVGACAAAPLMRFTGFECLLVSAQGQSNAGKTSMSRFGMAIWGKYDAMKLKPNDTPNAKIARIGRFGSLPAYVDEITNIDPMYFSDFVYELTSGRSKLRLKQDGSERPTHEWNTIAVCSGNTSIITKLGLAKANPEAERLRVFEFPLDRNGQLTPEMGDRLYKISHNNYGHVGPLLIKYIVENQAAVQREMEIMIDYVRKEAASLPQERIWTAGVACILYGLTLLKRLELSHIAVEPVKKWAVARIRELRMQMEDITFNPLDLLSIYVNEFAASRLTIKDDIVRKGSPQTFTVERYPSRDLLMRYEVSRQRLFVGTRHYQDWLNKKHESWQKHKQFLENNNILVRVTPKNIGVHTTYSGAPVRCMELNMSMMDAENVLQLVATNDVGHERRRLAQGD